MLPPTMESVVDEDDSTNSLPPDVQKMNDLIRNGVDRLDSFEDIKRQIILSNFSPLTNYPDIEYVRRYYVEYSCELWINESVVAIISITDGEEMGALIGMFSHINAICNIENVCQPWNESDYFQILLKHKHLISSAEQTKYVSNWKMECLKAIVTATKTIRNEIDFIEAFLNLIITVKKQYLKYLQLLDAKTDKITLKDIYDRIMKVSKYFNSTDLQEFTRIVNRKNLRVQFHLSSMFFDLVSNLDKSPELVVDEIDGRKIILVSALNLVMSDVIKNVEHLLMNDADILEVRFIGGHIIHADVDLQNNVWHGKNIVAFSRVLKVHGKVTWDVSGKDNNKVYESDAGTDEFGNGLQGNDGFAGESGGNVLIQADQMRNSIEFNVISNGGMGSPGQNGGNGRNGANGIGICNESFKNNFPPVCNVSEPYSSIRKSFESVEVDDSSKFYKCFRNIFIKGKTYEGFESTFGARTCYRAFVLCEGLPAKPAGIGGEFGLGGHGGYPGQIDGVIGETKPGIPGCNGEGGNYGKPGINGWDMGYIDYFKFFGFGKSTQYFGTSENYRLALQKYTFSGDNHVWCEYLQSYITIEKSSVINANVKYYSEKRTTRSNYDRKSHALPSRKKTISKTNVHEVYSKYVNAGIEALESRRSDLTELEKLAALEIQKSFKQKQKISSKLKKHIAQNSFISSRQISMDDCTTNLNMNSVETNGISKLFEAFIEINSKLMFQMRNENIDELEREQYFPRIITRSLVRNYISSQSLGSLDKFLFENYENEDIHRTMMFIIENYTKYQDCTLTRAVKRYILSNVQNSTTTTEQYYKSYCNFLAKQKTDLNKYLKSFVEEFSKPIYEELRRLFLLCATSTSEINNFEYKLEESQSELNTIYNNINKCLKQEYDWNIYCNQRDVLDELENDIRQGIRSSSFREILSYVFDVNIRYYIVKNNQYFAADCHNPLARKTLHLLHENERIHEMETDEKYLELLHIRRLNIDKYKSILTDVSLLKIEDVTEYIKKNIYLLNKSDNSCHESIHDDFAYIETIMYYLIKSFNCQRKVEILERRLRKLSSKFIATNRILYYLMKRFVSENVQISYEELCFIINSIISFEIYSSDEHILIEWIIVTCQQTHWIIEILFLKLQNYFRKSLSNEIDMWRRSLLKLDNKSMLLLLSMTLDQHNEVCITIDKLNEIFNYLTEISSIITSELEGLGISEWPQKLKELSYSWIISQGINLSKAENSTATHFIVNISNHIGKEHTIQFLKTLLSRNMTNSGLMYVLFWFKSVCEEDSVTTADLLTFKNNPNSLVWADNLKSKYLKSSNERTYFELINLMKVKLIDNIDEFDLDSIFERLSKVGNASHAWYQQIIDFAANKLNLEQWFCNQTTTDEEILSAIDKVIEAKRSFKLRDSQKLSVMILITKKNILAQISTGEGKSLIIVAFAIIKAMRRETLHVVTSSTVLAQRDATINNDIYSAFGINVGDNCDQVIDKRKQSYSRNKVIYGELSYFQRDYLLDTFFDENILGGNSFHNVMIDEVDSLLVDKGNNMLYLSHEIAGFDKIESVYIFIWNWINSPVKSEENFADIFNENDIHNAVMHEIYNIIDEKDLQSIDSGLTESEVTSLWFSLIDMKILDSKGKVVTNDIAKTDLDIILPEKFKTYSSRLAFLFRNCIDRPRNICLPNYLKGFVELHLKKWIRSAISALFMKEFQNYVIDVDRSGSSSDRNPIVVILDTDTGTDQLNSQWDEALHQFLQLKHGCKLTMQSLKSVYISNVSYFKLYKNKFGVTGTLGSEQELSLLRDLHEVTTVTIPTSKAKQFTPREPILCKTIDLWIEEIKKEAMSIIENESRSILIICETMHEVNLLHGKLRNVIEMVTYTRDYEEFAEKENLSCGTAIIATNLAGRGTDIKLSRELCERGGLHVCMTYLPGNCRVEEQGFGRSARRGEMGSGRLIVISDEADMTSLQMKRDEAELRRVSDIKSYYDRQIRTEESYFKQFTDTYEMLKRRVENLDFSKVLLDSCLDKWAMWLDSISEHISMIENEQSKLFADNSLKALLSELNELKPEGTYENWVSHNQMRMTALAKCFLDTRRYDIALALFNEVIHNEPLFCETAYYYRALIYRNSTENIADMHKSLVEASKLFTHHRNQLLIYSNTVDIIKDTTNVGLIQIQSYNEQKKCTYEIYSAYLQSIDDILGSPITMETFSEMDGELLRTLHNDLIERNILRRSKANGDIDNRTLKAVANEFKISFTSLREILNETNELTDDKTFQQELKDRLNFCSKDNFWNELRCKNIITDVVEYISVKISKFKNYFEEYCDLASEQNKKSELSLLLNQTSVLFFDLENMRKDIYDENCLILEKVDLAAIIGNNNIAFMMNKDITTTNYVGIINAENCESSFLNSHDSITKQDFLDQNISEDDTDIILNHLTQLEILAKDDVNTNVYRLGEGFAKMDGQNLPSWNLYEETILRLMSDRFFFRMNLQEIRKCIDAGEKIALLDFSPNPHQLLYWSLVENRFVEKGIVCFSDVSIIEQYVSDIQNFIITKKIIRDMLITFGRIRDENLVNNIWAHLLEQRWILAGNTGLTDGKFVISYINICRINLDRHVEYEVILRDGLKNRVHLGAFGEMIYDKLKNLNTPDISKCKLVLGDSSGLNSYLYASEEMQALRICGLDEFLSFKTRFSWKRCVKLVFGVCKILLSVAYRVISDIFHNTRDGISQRLFNSGFADIKESFAISNITWHDYIKYRMIDIMRNCVKYAKGFIYRGNRLSRSQNKISRVVAHATKSMEFQPSINIFLSNLNRDIQATIMERIDVELEIKLEEENSLLQKCSRQLGVETFQHIFMDYFVKKDNNIRLAIVLSNIKGEMMTKIRKITKKILAEGSNRITIEKLHSTINISQEHINDLLETFEDIMNNSISEFSVDVPLDAPAEENIDTKLLKKFLHDITDNFLVENLMDPIFTEGARIMNDIFLKRDMEVYETTLCKDNSSDDVCLKMNLLENRRNAEESAQRKTIYCADVLTNTYNQKISCLLERVRDISSFAELLTENASINEVYLKLFVRVIPKVLNLDCLTIYVNYEDNSCQKYSTNETSGSPTVINISLVNGKFQLYDNGYVDDFKQFLKHPNNLYIALSGKYHCLITQERFAELIAKHIEKENELNSILKNIWKKLDESSEQYVTESNLQDPINEEYNYEIDDIKKNLKAIVAKKIYKEDDDFEIIEKFDITLESQNIEAKPGTSTDT